LLDLAPLHRAPVRRVIQRADQLNGKGFGLAGHGRKSGRPIAAVLGRFSADLGCVVLD